MSLLPIFLTILSDWRSLFCKKQAFLSAIFHAIASLTAQGKKTMTCLIAFMNEHKKDWSRHYKLYSRASWEAQELFYPIIKRSVPLFNKPYITLVADYTGTRKTGKKIANSGWQKDPMSPKFRPNLRWGLTFLQMAVCLPLYEKNNQPPRTLPIRWVNLKRKPRPSKKASLEEKEAYNKFCQEHNRSKIFVNELKKTREAFDHLGALDKRLLISLDGEFCNKTVLSSCVERTDFILRARKNSKLCVQDKSGGRRFYAKEKFTPEEIRQDRSIPWQKAEIYHGGQYRTVYYKLVQDVLWQGGAKRQFLDLLVIRPIPYRRSPKGKLMYRDPAYLLCTKQLTPVKERIQAYFDRWQIEVNHKDEKDTLGVGQAQIRNEKSVEAQPALMVAAYSALLLASILADIEQLINKDDLLPAWYKRIKRLSTKHLIRILTHELQSHSIERFKQAA